MLWLEEQCVMSEALTTLGIPSGLRFARHLARFVFPMASRPQKMRTIERPLPNVC